jgi:hypothetical protein
MPLQINNLTLKNALNHGHVFIMSSTNPDQTFIGNSPTLKSGILLMHFHALDSLIKVLSIRSLQLER